jgi:hypothetical protein
MTASEAFENHIGDMPSPSTWESRLGQYRHLEGLASEEGQQWHGPRVTVEHSQIEGLRRELEHCYAAGAWIACILLAHAVVELTMKSRGYKKPLQWEAALKQFKLDGGAEWLRNLRNCITHRDLDQDAIVSLVTQLSDREEHRHQAKKAVSIALRVSFTAG